MSARRTHPSASSSSMNVHYIARVGLVSSCTRKSMGGFDGASVDFHCELETRTGYYGLSVDISV